MVEATAVHRNIERVDPDTVKAFEGLDVSTVYESLVEDGLLPEDIHTLMAGATVCGPAVTAHNAPGDNLAMHVALEIAGPGDVLVVATGPEPAATWGGQVTEAAVGKGIAGVVTDGYVRDVAAYRQHGFGVWARGVSPRHAEKSSLVGVNAPVKCAGVLVHPGDLVIGDDDGVVVVRRSTVAEVLERATGRLARENEAVPLLAQGKTPFELHGMSSALDAIPVTITD